jgi:predicted membrane chloride channel (bestrophin family)
MIRYRKTCCGLFLLFRIAGTAWPYGIFPGCLATGISIALSLWQQADDEIRDRDQFISHPYAFQLFAYLLGFLMVFRTNFAYQRYWEAIGMVQAMGAKWLDGACMGITFDAGGRCGAPLLDGMHEDRSLQAHPTTGSKGGPVHYAFAADIVHLCSLLHALALQHFRGDSDLGNLVVENDINGETLRGSLWTLAESEESCSGTASPIRQRSSISDMLTKAHTGEFKTKIGLGAYSESSLKQKYQDQQLKVLGGLSPSERAVLERDLHGNAVTTEARVAMVEGWFMRRLIARQKFEQGESSATSPPILSRLYQVISDGCLWFSHASKIAITPFPFPYHNLMSIFLWTYTFMAPVLVNALIMDDVARAIISFNAVFAYHSLAAVGDNLEDPYFAYDINELPLQELQDTVNQRLLAFGVVPDDVFSQQCASTSRPPAQTS